MDPEFWTRQFHAIGEAPVFFVFALAIISIVIWQLMRRLQSQILDGLHSRLNALDTQLNLAREMESVLRQILTRLKGQLNDLRDFTESDQPKETLLNSLRSADETLIAVTTIGDALARELRRESPSA